MRTSRLPALLLALLLAHDAHAVPEDDASAGVTASTPPAKTGDAKLSKKKPRLSAFRPQWLTPYLTTGAAGRARDALVAGKPALAVRLLRPLVAAHPSNQARFLLAHALLQDQQFAQAQPVFDALVESYPLLADYHRFEGARCRYRQKQFREAEALAAKVERASPLWGDAQLLRADALRALAGKAGKAEGQAAHEAVVKIWGAFLARHPRGKRVGQAHYRMAQSLEQRARGADRARRLTEALEHYKQVVITSPLWRRTPEARRRLEQLARVVKDGSKLAALSPWESFTQAREYYLKVRHDQAEAAFGAILKQKQLDPQLRCKATYYLAMTVFRKRQRARSAPLFARAAEHCTRAGQQDLTVKSLYNGAKGLMQAHRFDEAIRQFAVVEQKYARHSYADDARLWAAEAAESKGDAKQAQQLLDTLPERYPGGDMRREALWRLARAAIIKHDHDEALRQLDRILTRLGRARYYYAQGQALYWKARILEQKKQTRPAGELYERCIREYPLSYYALMAFNRLKEGHAALYNKLWRELIVPVGRRAGIWRFEPRELFGRPGFLRGVELARLGFAVDAAAELVRVGVGIRKGVPGDDLWLAAVLFDRARLWDRSHQVPRSMDHAYRQGYPLLQEYRRWSIAYPRAFEPLVNSSARRADVPPELVWAVMREESGFSTTIESWANAVGLMQLLVRTAKRAGSEHRMEVDRQRLHDPAVNIKLGATYLGFLRQTFGGSPALAIAGYNAGEGAVARWLRQMGQVPLDEFLDRIPYDQTRRYTKRVLSSLFTYSVLHRPARQRLVRLGQTLPGVTRVTLGRPSSAKGKDKGKGKSKAQPASWRTKQRSSD